jgi:NAD(P)-dependent dehydrogenase (short-subunit alcohol dehydrogenase family)
MSVDAGAARPRTILVTGAGTNGIGAAVVRRLMAPEARFAIHAYGEVAKAEALASEVCAAGGRASIHVADFGEADSARQLVDEAAALHGSIDVVVHCAAASVRKPAMNTSTEDLDRLLAINVRGAFEIIQQSAAHMLKRDIAGRIVVIGSVNQHLVLPGQAAYCATKGAIMQLAKTFALELARTGITVNIVAPGTVETDLNRHLLVDPAFRSLRETPIPMGRIAGPDEIAGAVAYLASDEARYTTGSTIVVDGGLSLS